MKKYIFYTCLFFFFLYWLFGFYKAIRAVNFEFKGTVQKVTSTSNSGYYKTITVNNKDYDLEWVRWYDDLYKIEVGDSVIKNKGNQSMTLIKKR